MVKKDFLSSNKNEVDTCNDIEILADSKPAEYEMLVARIDNLWSAAKNRAVEAVNTELIDANWQTGQYIVEFEQQGKIRAEYGKQLINRLAKDLTVLRGRGFSRSNLIYMRKFYLCFPKSETVSHLLTWSHYFELLKCEDEMDLLRFCQIFSAKMRRISPIFTAFIFGSEEILRKGGGENTTGRLTPKRQSPGGGVHGTAVAEPITGAKVAIFLGKNKRIVKKISLGFDRSAVNYGLE